jgi:hypothetical protein
MEANELRRGNWVNVTDKDYQVTQILERGVNCGHIGAMYDLVKPIPLTEEWLLKFGYTNTNEEYLTGNAVEKRRRCSFANSHRQKRCCGYSHIRLVEVP